MEKAQEILFHLDELYSDNASEERVLMACDKNPTRYQAWVEAFKDYDLSDVLTAIDEYWEYKNNKTKPSVAQIKAKLNARNVEKLAQQTTVTEASCGDWAWEQMNHDIETGDCKSNLYMYRRAEDLIINGWLPKEMPVSEWSAMSRTRRVEQAKAKGLFANYTEALAQVCRERFGRDYEFLSANQQQAVQKGSGVPLYTSGDKILAAHWKVAYDEALE